MAEGGPRGGASSEVSSSVLQSITLSTILLIMSHNVHPLDVYRILYVPLPNFYSQLQPHNMS